MTDVPSTLARHRRPVRLVLGLGLVSGLAMSVYFLVIAAESPLAWDFMAYYRGAEAAVAGEPFIGLEPDRGGGEYVYPPLVVLAFVPYLLAGNWPIAFAIHGLLNAIVLAGLGWLVLRELEHLGVDLDRLDRWLVMAFAVASLYPLVSIGLGQVDPIVALGLAVVFYWSEVAKQTRAGLALAGAATIKLFPAAVGLWFLRRRHWRAAATATLGGLAAGIASVAVFGLEVNQHFLEFILVDRSRLSAFASGVSPDFFSVSLIRPISTLMPDAVPPVWYLVIAVAVVAPTLWVVYRHIETRLDRHVAFLATIVAVLIVLPSTNLNHFLMLYFPVMVLGYALEAGAPRRWLLVGLGVLLVPIQPAILRSSLESIPGIAGAIGPIHEVATAVLSFASIALLGAVIVLIACVRHAIDRPLTPMAR